MAWADHIDELINILGLDMSPTPTYYVGACPVHGGDNKTACNVFTNGKVTRGNWVCYTHNCHKKWGNSLVGFVQGVLSRKKGETIGKQQAIAFLIKQFGYSKPRRSSSASSAFVALVNQVTKQRPDGLYDIETISKYLTIPSPYYLSRKYRPDILCRYHVGDCWKDGPMYGRAVVPIFDDDHQWVVGVTGRSIDGSPPKWKNSKGFARNAFLFNYWFARPHIKTSREAILVEGPGDVFALEQIGIHNSLALFGLSLTDEQHFLLHASGATKLTLWLDNDKAGREAVERLKERLTRSFELQTSNVLLMGKDPGELVDKR